MLQIIPVYDHSFKKVAKFGPISLFGYKNM